MCLRDGTWLFARLASAMRRSCSRQFLLPQSGPQNKDAYVLSHFSRVRLIATPRL